MKTQLKRLELYDRNLHPKGITKEADPILDQYRRHLRQLRHQSQQPIHLVTRSYRTLFSAMLTNLEELVLDGAYCGQYFLWELLMETLGNFSLNNNNNNNKEDKSVITLKRLKLYRYTTGQLMSPRVLKSINKSMVAKQLTHLTLDFVNYNILNFVCTHFRQLEYFDIGVREGVS